MTPFKWIHISLKEVQVPISYDTFYVENTRKLDHFIKKFFKCFETRSKSDDTIISTVGGSLLYGSQFKRFGR